MENRQYKIFEQIILNDEERLMFEYKSGDVLVYDNHFSIVNADCELKSNAIGEKYISVTFIDHDNDVLSCGSTNLQFKCLLRYNNQVQKEFQYQQNKEQ